MKMKSKPQVNLLIVLLIAFSSAVAHAVETTDLVPPELAQPIAPSEIANAADVKLGINEEKNAAATAAVPVSGTSASAEAVKATAQMKETEIPVHLENSKRTAATENPWVRLMATFAIVTMLGAGTYVALKRKAKAKTSKKDAPEIKVLTQHYLGPKKSLAIIRVAGESILVGVTDQNITHIKTLSLIDDEVPLETPSRFDSVFNDEMNSISESASMAAIRTSSVDAFANEKGDEDFSIHGIKDFVSGRLKNMRSLE